jgi:hypothetical protein
VRTFSSSFIQIRRYADISCQIQGTRNCNREYTMVQKRRYLKVYMWGQAEICPLLASLAYCAAPRVAGSLIEKGLGRHCGSRPGLQTESPTCGRDAWCRFTAHTYLANTAFKPMYVPLHWCGCSATLMGAVSGQPLSLPSRSSRRH